MIFSSLNLDMPNRNVIQNQSRVANSLDHDEMAHHLHCFQFKVYGLVCKAERVNFFNHLNSMFYLYHVRRVM